MEQSQMSQKQASSEVIEDFYGVYLLYCKNPKYLGRTYIGYTVNPNRRLKQHNKGSQAGGAWRTSKRGPWSMAMIVHGFPNDVAALRFEWAWQHPERSRRLNHLAKKGRNEKQYAYRLRILSEMLRVGPWNRLPLTVRWLDEELIHEFDVDKGPPLHMPITQGGVVSKKVNKLQQNDDVLSQRIIEASCCLCDDTTPSQTTQYLHCLNVKCTMQAHIICLAKLFNQPGDHIPISGCCPYCNMDVLWGDLVRKAKGCYQSQNITISNVDDVYISD